MSNELFEGAKFGDRFLTRNDTLVIYLGSVSTPKEETHILMVENMMVKVSDDDIEFHELIPSKNGSNFIFDGQFDIVSRLEDDNDYIEAIAIKECPNNTEYREIYKKGFKKALGAI